MAKKFSHLLEGMSEERRALIRAEAEEMIQETALAELRRARSLTQTELANRLGVRQPSIADMEKRTDMYISTLRRLVEAMGGNLDIIARFSGMDVRIQNFSNLDAPASPKRDS